MTAIFEKLKQAITREQTPFDLLKTGNTMYRNGLYDEALKYYRLALNKNLKNKNRHVVHVRAEYEIRNRICAALYSLRQYDKVINECDILLELLEKEKDKTEYVKNLYGKAFVRKGGAYFFSQSFDKAQECYLNALKNIVDRELQRKTLGYIEFTKQREKQMKAMKKNQNTLLYQIPQKAFFNILKFLDAFSIGALMKVSFRLHEICSSRLLWKYLCDRDFPSHALSCKDWTQLYLEMWSDKC